MTRVQFLNDLYRRLGSSMSREQAEQHLTYYAEMLMDRMEEGMSEEEAVASMEDVDTIARRILQEEGQPPAAPAPVLRAAEPQVSPPPSQPPEPPARNWRKPVKIALWAVAALAVVWVAAGRLQSGNRASDGAVALPGEGVSPVDKGIHISPDGIEINGGSGGLLHVGPDGIEVGGESWEDLVSNGWSGWEDGGSYDDYPGEFYELSAAGIEAVEVEWVAGTVEVLPGEDGRICFTESSSAELTEGRQLFYEQKGDTLLIRFQKKYGGSSVNYGKRLQLVLPTGLLEKLQVETISADVSAMDIQLKDLEVTATSGNVQLWGVWAKSAEVSSTSGEIEGNVLAEDIQASSVSGDIALHVSGASEMDLESISGDIALGISAELGFTLEYKTVSGDLDSGDFVLASRDGKYISGSGTCEIEVETVSGDLTLLTD